MKRLRTLQISRYALRVLLSPWLYLLVRVALAAVFIYAGASKLMDPKAFARTISHYNLVPEPLLPVVAVGLPAIEVLAGIALILDLGAGIYGVSGLLLLFVFVLGYGVLNELNIDCGCFGPEELAGRNSLVGAFYRDLALMGGVAFLHCSRLLRDRHRLSNKPAQKLIT